MTLKKLFSRAKTADPFVRHKIVYPKPSYQLPLAITFVFASSWFDLDYMTASCCAHSK
jgi:hypothetical protein